MTTSEQRSGMDRRRTADRRRIDRTNIDRTGTHTLRYADSAFRRNHFVASISHEIRTPMHAILAMVDLLGETPLTQQQERYIELFKDAGEHLLSLLNELLDYSRIESGEVQLNSVPFHLPRLVEAVLELMRSQARDKDIVFRCNIDPSLVCWRRGDPQRLRQILVNLINNAIKFTHAGEINIKVMAMSADRVLLEVVDTGVGIPEAEQKRIFDSFVQGDLDHDQRLQGVGLGLAICKQLAKAMEGNIYVSSRVGVGSRFVFDLPLPAVSDPCTDVHMSDTRTCNDQRRLPVLSILVVDDSHLNCRVMEDLLRQFGCKPRCVSNGQEAIKYLLSEHYDLILMDVRMPVMDGLRATRAIRHLERFLCGHAGHHQAIPIVALSANADPEEKRAALEAGCDDYLVKPLRKEELTQVLLERFALPL